MEWDLFTRKSILYTFIWAACISSGHAAHKNRPYQDVLSERYLNCNLKKENVFLSDLQVKNIASLYGGKVSKLILRYKNNCDDDSFVYIDSHIVRTLNQTVLIELKNQKVKLLEVASFMEPKEYLAPKLWLKQFIGSPKTEIDGLTGATLTENAIKKLVQKYRVIDNVLNDSK